MPIFSAWTRRAFHRLLYRGPEGRKTWQTTRWMGVQALKNPFDLWIYQEILFRTRPQIIVETGIHAGGTSLYLANLLDLLDAPAELIAVDITLEHLADPARRHPRCTFLQGSSTDPAIARRIADRCAGKRAMVILDSDHARDHVLRELELYAPLVSPHCYLIVEDTNVNGHPVFPAHGPGPWEAVHRFLQSHRDQWQVDRDCERYLVSFNPGGYLLRLPSPP